MISKHTYVFKLSTVNVELLKKCLKIFFLIYDFIHSKVVFSSHTRFCLLIIYEQMIYLDGVRPVHSYINV